MNLGLRIVLAFLLGVAVLAQAADSTLPPMATDMLPDAVWGKCQFSVQETEHIKLYNRQVKGITSYPPLCQITVRPIGFSVVGGSTESLMVVPRKMENNKPVVDYAGFWLDKESVWHYDGFPLTDHDKILKHSFSQNRQGDSLTLVGHETVEVHAHNGDVGVNPGIQVMRITPQFIVVADFLLNNFLPKPGAPSLPKTLPEQIARELADVVNSVELAPGVAHPVVRP